MKYLEDFIIPLTGSKDGVNEFSFVLDKRFFTHFEDDEVLDGEVNVALSMRKGINIYEMNFHLVGNLTLNCDRCLEPMVQEIEIESDLIVKHGAKYEEIDDKIVTIGDKEDNIDVSSFVYEYAKLALPIQRTHSEGECNEDMLEQMQKYERVEEVEKETDSRWDALADLKSKLNE